MHQEERKSCPSIWPGGWGRIPRPRPSGLTTIFFPEWGHSLGAWQRVNASFVCFSHFSLSPHQLTRTEKPSAEAVRLALDCNARTFPKWPVGMSQLTEAVAMPTCQSEASTTFLSLQSCGVPRKKLHLCCDATAPGAQLRTLVFMESHVGVRQDGAGQDLCSRTAILCAVWGSRVSLVEMLPEWVESGPGHVEKGSQRAHLPAAGVT